MTRQRLCETINPGTCKERGTIGCLCLLVKNHKGKGREKHTCEACDKEWPRVKSNRVPSGT